MISTNSKVIVVGAAFMSSRQGEAVRLGMKQDFGKDKFQNDVLSTTSTALPSLEDEDNMDQVIQEILWLKKHITGNCDIELPSNADEIKQCLDMGLLDSEMLEAMHQGLKERHVDQVIPEIIWLKNHITGDIGIELPGNADQIKQQYDPETLKLIHDTLQLQERYEEKWEKRRCLAELREQHPYLPKDIENVQEVYRWINSSKRKSEKNEMTKKLKNEEKKRAAKIYAIMPKFEALFDDFDKIGLPSLASAQAIKEMERACRDDEGHGNYVYERLEDELQQLEAKLMYVVLDWMGKSWNEKKIKALKNKKLSQEYKNLTSEDELKKWKRYSWKQLKEWVFVTRPEVCQTIFPMDVSIDETYLNQWDFENLFLPFCERNNLLNFYPNSETWLPQGKNERHFK